MEFCLPASPEASRLLRVARRDLKMARRLFDPEVEEASWDGPLSNAWRRP